MEFSYDGGGLAKGGDVTLYHDGEEVGSGRVEATHPMIFSADETTDIGYESGTTVSPDYTAHTSRFTGKIAGSSSMSAPTTTTTSSIPRNGCGSPWPGSEAGGASRPHDAAEAQVAGGGIDGLTLPRSGPVAQTVVGRAQVRSTLDHLRRRRLGRRL